MQRTILAVTIATLLALTPIAAQQQPSQDQQESERAKSAKKDKKHVEATFVADSLNQHLLQQVNIQISAEFESNLFHNPNILKAHAAVQVETGVTDSYVRLSIGIEHIDDILADLDQALQAV